MKHYYFNFVKNGDIGRQLYKLFRVSGLSNIAVDFTPYYYTNYSNFNSTFYLENILSGAIEKNILPQHEIENWLIDLKECDQKGEFFAYGSGIIVYGNAK